LIGSLASSQVAAGSRHALHVNGNVLASSEYPLGPSDIEVSVDIDGSDSHMDRLAAMAMHVMRSGVGFVPGDRM
jgi:hypothetical protein